jgi:sugar-specific transcriptional regulator TrmB
VQNEDLNAFIDLGLKITEAKVYITLVEEGTIRASVISEVSKVARPEVYRALSSLQELGLVEKIIANPFLFRSNPVEVGVNILLKKKARKYTELESRSVNLIASLSSKKNHNRVPRSHFVLVPSKHALVKSLCQSIERTRECIDVFTSCKRLKFACHCLSEELENAWKRGVKARAIIEETNEPNLDFQKTCWRYPYAKIKYIQSFPKTIMAVYDSREVFIFVENEADLT